MMQKFFVLFSLWILSLFFPISIAEAQNPPPTPGPISDDQVNAVARDMYCPVCENTPLDVCPTVACAEWRELIRDKLAEGWSEEQIEAYFIERFGDRVSATPPPRGINWLAYIVPPLAFLGGSYFLFRIFKKQRMSTNKETVIEGPALLPADEDYVDRLEEELRKY